MWKSMSEATDEDRGYCFFESFIKNESFITPITWHVLTWLKHSHPANELMITHFWVGEDTPTEFPADRVERVDPLGRLH